MILFHMTKTVPIFISSVSAMNTFSSLPNVTLSPGPVESALKLGKTPAFIIFTVSVIFLNRGSAS